MITRKYSYLAGSNLTKKVEVKVDEDNCVGLLYIKNKGYGLYNTKEDFEDSLFIIDTKMEPNDFKTKTQDQEQFIQLVKINLDLIYADKVAMKTYNKKHPEYLLLELMDNLESADCEILDNKNKQSKILQKGFDKLNIETIKSFL